MVNDGSVRLVSPYGHYYTRFNTLAREVGRLLQGNEAVLDGELVCLYAEGKSQFYDLLRNRSIACLAAFDLLWLDGNDLRQRLTHGAQSGLAPPAAGRAWRSALRGSFRASRSRSVQRSLPSRSRGHCGQIQTRSLSHGGQTEQLGKDQESGVLADERAPGIIRQAKNGVT